MKTFAQRLTAAFDQTTGTVVLIDEQSNIKFYATDGKMSVPIRYGTECESCVASNLRFAQALAEAWNNSITA